MVISIARRVPVLPRPSYNINETFEGVTPPALPANWITGGLVTASSVGLGGTKSLASVNNLQANNFQYTGPNIGGDSLTWRPNSGNVQLQCDCLQNTIASAFGSAVFLHARWNENGGSPSTSASPRGYLFSFGTSTGGTTGLAKLIYRPGLGVANVVLTSLTFTLSVTEFYRLTFTALGSSLSAIVRRQSDGQYLQANGTFGPAQVSCLTATDINIIFSGGAGVSVFNDAVTASMVIDNVTIQSIPITQTTKVLPRVYTQHVPGQRWYDTNGEIINALNGCVFWDTATSAYYLYGGDYSGPTGYANFGGLNGPTRQSLGIWVYKSVDLLNWRNLGLAWVNDGLTWFGGRPKVLWCASTSKYVMCFHEADAALSSSKIPFLTATAAAGPFTVQSRITSSGLGSHSPGDLTLFQDGTDAYLYFQSGAATYGCQLSSDYLTPGAVSAQTTLGNSNNIEAICVIKNGSNYYLVGSLLAGWQTSVNYIFAAKSTSPLSGWSNTGNPCQAATGQSSSNGYNHQPFHIFKTQGNVWVYASNQWNQWNLADSGIAFLPFDFDGSANARVNWSTGWAPTP